MPGASGTLFNCVPGVMAARCWFDDAAQSLMYRLGAELGAAGVLQVSARASGERR
jgi:hypothetical protein